MEVQVEFQTAKVRQPQFATVYAIRSNEDYYRTVFKKRRGFVVVEVHVGSYPNSRKAFMPGATEVVRTRTLKYEGTKKSVPWSDVKSMTATCN